MIDRVRYLSILHAQRTVFPGCQCFIRRFRDGYIPAVPNSGCIFRSAPLSATVAKNFFENLTPIIHLRRVGVWRDLLHAMDDIEDGSSATNEDVDVEIVDPAATSTRFACARCVGNVFPNRTKKIE